MTKAKKKALERRETLLDLAQSFAATQLQRRQTEPNLGRLDDSDTISQFGEGRRDIKRKPVKRSNLKRIEAQQYELHQHGLEQGAPISQESGRIEIPGYDGDDWASWLNSPMAGRMNDQRWEPRAPSPEPAYASIQRRPTELSEASASTAPERQNSEHSTDLPPAYEERQSTAEGVIQGSEVLPLFEFDRIGEQEIRLITVAPSRNPDSPLKCLVTTHRRDEYPGYIAISYVWGSVKARSYINCNDRRLEVTQSCETTLKAVRHDREEQTFWVDAMCINQDDLEERKVQVAHMGDIYRLAMETFIYLGASDRKWNLFDDNIKTSEWQGIFQRPWFERTWVIQELLLSRTVTAVIGTQRLPWLGLLALCEARGIQLPRIIDLRNEFVHDYGRRPPKSLQEVDEDGEAFMGGGDSFDEWEEESANKAAFPLRKESMFAETFTDEPSSISEPASSSRPSRTSTQQTDHAPFSRPTRQLTWNVNTTQKESGHVNLNYWRLLDLMSRTHPFKCQDPRDKLFAVLPLFTRPIPQLLYPDYSKTVAEVYTDLSYFLLTNELAHALTYASATQSWDSMPSWATNWAKPELETHKSYERYENGRAGFAAGGREIRPKRSEDGRCVTLRGLQIGRVARREHSGYFGFLSPGLAHSIEAKGNMVDTSTSAGKGNLLKVKWKVSKRAGLDSGPVDLGWSSAAMGLFERIEESLAVAEQTRNAATISEDTADGRKNCEIQVEDGNTAEVIAVSVIDAYLEELESGLYPDLLVVGFTTPRSSFSHYLFQCKVDKEQLPGDPSIEKRIIGESLWAVEPKDVVCVLLGFEVPFVLRQADGEQWKLIGECRLKEERVMQGSLVDGLEWERVWDEPCMAPLMDFTLC